MKTLPGIEYKKLKSNPTVDSDNSMFTIPYYKNNEYLSDLDNFVNFIKGVESIVRTSDRYKKYIKYLKEVVGLTYCQVLSNIREEMATIEMHHGPILTLFDICTIVTDHLLYKDQYINTFIVADIVLDQHYLNNIQVVMLSATVHQEVHDNNVFINIKQAFGNLESFLSTFKYGVQDDQIKKIRDYIEISKKFDSNDNNILSLESSVNKWEQ
ncbi:MAG: hypothetical protein PHF63_00965 [Herbinix sp.]|nr:hypothetical protein [Herbinix sp.]